MKILITLLKSLFCLLILALLLLPLVLLYQISNDEMQYYQMPTVPPLHVVSNSRVYQSERMDVDEYFVVSGVFTSDTVTYMELDYKNPNQIRWEVSVGDEIKPGDILGTYDGEPVEASCAGIIESISTYADAYVKVRLLQPLVLECNVAKSDLSLLKLPYGMTLENGAAVTLLSASSVQQANGTYRVQLQIDSPDYVYGERVEDLKIKTGRKFMQALVLPQDCVYQKNGGADGKWYVREVTKDGEFIRESTVEIGYPSGDFVCVTGIQEGSYFDADYKTIAEG